MIKRYLNRAYDLGFIKPLVPLWLKRNQSKSMILLYHRFDKEGVYPFLDQGGNPNTVPDQFRDDIRLLKSFGAKFKTVSQLLENKDPNSFNIAICIDDGFKSNYETGMDICASEGIPQTIFQCSSMLSGRALIWEHSLYYLFFHPSFGEKLRTEFRSNNLPTDIEKLKFLLHPNRICELLEKATNSSQEIKDELKALAVEIYPSENDLKRFVSTSNELGSHGADHWPRSSITQGEFETQISKSKSVLEKIVNQNIESFSYPFNDYYDQDLVACKRYYNNVFSVEPGFLNNVNQGPVRETLNIPRNTYPGTPKSALRHRRWLLTGRI